MTNERVRLMLTPTWWNSRLETTAVGIIEIRFGILPIQFDGGVGQLIHELDSKGLELGLS